MLHKTDLYFWKLVGFSQSYEGLSTENYKKTIKNYVFVVAPSV